MLVLRQVKLVKHIINYFNTVKCIKGVVEAMQVTPMFKVAFYAPG